MFSPSSSISGRNSRRTKNCLRSRSSSLSSMFRLIWCLISLFFRFRIPNHSCIRDSSSLLSPIQGKNITRNTFTVNYILVFKSEWQILNSGLLESWIYHYECIAIKLEVYAQFKTYQCSVPECVTVVHKTRILSLSLILWF